MMRGWPVLISAVTPMPEARSTTRSSTWTLRAVEADARGVEKLLTGRLAGARRLAGLLVGVGLRGRLVAHDGGVRDAGHLAVDQAVLGEVQGVDLDLGGVAVVHEA